MLRDALTINVIMGVALLGPGARAASDARKVVAQFHPTARGVSVFLCVSVDGDPAALRPRKAA